MAQTRSPAHAAYGQAFRQLRGERGISQERLAQLAGLDRTYVSGIERGERNPSLANLLKLAQTLEVGLGEVAARAYEITLGSGSSAQRHPISLALERSALALKGLNQETTPISDDDAREILHDATRVVGELLEVLARFEAETRQRTGVLNELADVFARLEREFSRR